MADESKKLAGFAVEGEVGMASWLRDLGGERPAIAVLSMCLTMAARRGDAVLARRLLAEGADPQLAEQPASDEDGAHLEVSGGGSAWAAPWSAAVAADSVECLEAMVEAGMNPVSPRVMQKNLIDEAFCLARVAASKGAPRCFERALEWAREREPLSMDKISAGAWTDLASGGVPAKKVEEMARALSLAGGDIEGKLEAFDGKTPLEFAAGTSASATRGLLAAGADPRNGNPVQCAVRNTGGETQECLDILLAAGASAEKPEGPHGVRYPISLAIANLDGDKVRSLIAAGANVFIMVDCPERSLLTKAVCYGAARCIGPLLSAGLDPDEKIQGVALAVWAEQQHVPGWWADPAPIIAELRAASEAKALAAMVEEPRSKRAAAPRM